MIPEYRSGDVDPNRSAVESIEDVPVYRRSWFASLLVIFGFFCCSPLLWWVCILCLTGDIYRNKVRPNGKLSRWSPANKWAAVLILLLQAGLYLWRFDRFMDRLQRQGPAPLPAIRTEAK